MNVYEAFKFPVPVISYCVLHQARKNVEKEDYLRTTRQLHERVREESEKLAWTFRREHNEAFARTVELISSRLRPFLQTPIKTDEEEVRKVIREGLEQLSPDPVGGLDRRIAGGLGGLQIGSTWSAEGMFVPVSSDHAMIKRMAKEGREYFGSLGFQMDKGAGRMFESMFVVEGGLNLDVLEHIVRDRLGIYSTTHGQHLLEFENVTFSSFNLVFLCGNLAGHPNSAVELVIYFSKPLEVQYEPFRSALSSVIQQFHDKFGSVHSSVWQRKLGLGVGKEYIARLRISGEGKQLSAVGKWLSSVPVEDFIRKSVLEGGKLALKENLF